MIHQTAEVHATAKIGKDTKIWNYAQVRNNVVIGDNCIIGKNVYIDEGVIIGNNCKIQNNVSLYHGVKLGDGVFIGPHVCTTNDKNPRAINVDETLKSGTDWKVTETLIKKGVSIGAGSVIVCGVTISDWAMVGAGSVVTRDVPKFRLVYGNPAREESKICKCGKKIESGERCLVCETVLYDVDTQEVLDGH